jgi:LPS sulfotransferase NodH
MPVIPTVSCVLATTPMAGAHVLASALEAAGELPLPREYFHPALLRSLAGEWGVAAGSDGRFDAYLNEVVARGTNPAGVFAMALSGAQLRWLLRVLRIIGSSAGTGDDAGLIASWFANPRYVHVVRKDKAAQALDWYRAVRRRSGPLQGHTYDLQEIRWFESIVSQQDSRWRDHFRRFGIRPLTLERDEVLGDRAAAARKVLEFIGLSAPAPALLEARAGAETTAGVERTAGAESGEDRVLARYREHRDRLLPLIGARRPRP